MLTPSKMVVDRQKSCEAVEESIWTHGERVAGSFADQLDPFLEEGEQPPDYDLLLRLLGRSLASAREDLVAADDVHGDELANDVEPRLRRDQAAERLRAEMRSLRDVVAGAYGGELALRAAGLDTEMSFDPMTLLRQSGRAIENLKDPGIDLGPPRVPNLALDFAAAVAQLEVHHRELREALDAVKHERRQADLTQVDKNEQMAIFNRRFLLTALMLEAIYRYADEVALADRVRPSKVRPGRRLVDVSDGDSEKEPKPDPKSPAPEKESEAPAPEPEPDAD